MVKRWQNLIHKKCPQCDDRMLNQQKGYYCQSCAFYISKQKMAEILTNPNHAAIRFLTPHEKTLLDRAITEIGLVPSDVMSSNMVTA